MLLLPEGQTGEAWQPSKESSDLSESGEQCVEECLNMFMFIAFRELSEIICSSVSVAFVAQFGIRDDDDHHHHRDDGRGATGTEIVESSIAECITLLRLRDNVILKRALQPYYIARTHTHTHVTARNL
jgi:hypothetical protein